MTALQGWTCYCHPCVPTAPHQQKVTVYARIGTAAFTTILIVAALVLAATGVINFKLKKEVKMPPVSDGSPALVHLYLDTMHGDCDHIACMPVPAFPYTLASKCWSNSDIFATNLMKQHMQQGTDARVSL